MSDDMHMKLHSETLERLAKVEDSCVRVAISLEGIKGRLVATIGIISGLIGITATMAGAWIAK